ncbi:hypothetical protein OEV98_15795 [Caldibacillus lycopersici]|uniref:Uncharacterized protein n=1 Tax=Perspicuibacillus lycopersici TaxID=1325689 RepID=A0AAE3LU21_9BACI|nr:hypothetical protein [Perspicuibacillus lycopersici]MCU9614998.1 hypothetical protein [Perspicuibacillus lycopersici]
MSFLIPSLIPSLLNTAIPFFSMLKGLFPMLYSWYTNGREKGSAARILLCN